MQGICPCITKQGTDSFAFAFMDLFCMAYALGDMK